MMHTTVDLPMIRYRIELWDGEWQKAHQYDSLEEANIRLQRLQSFDKETDFRLVKCTYEVLNTYGK